MKVQSLSFVLALTSLLLFHKAAAHDGQEHPAEAAKPAPAIFSPGEGPAQNPDQIVLQKVDFQQRLDAQLPMDLKFTDDNGNSGTLKSFIGDKPAVLVLAYTHCKTLCSMVLTGMAHVLQQVRLEPGVDFNVIAISIDPKEKPSDAHDKKLAYIAEFAKTTKGGGAPASLPSEKGWYFLSSTDDSAIHKVADTIGFKYAYVPATQEYAHPSGIMVVTPEGRVSRYFMGVNFPVKDMRLSLVDASTGKIGTLTDQVLLYCFHYDPQLGRYTLVINNALKVLGLLFLFALIIGITGMLWNEKRSARKRGPRPNPQPNPRSNPQGGAL